MAGQTRLRVKMRNLLTRAVFDKTFKASDKFKEPDLEMVPAAFLYSDADGFYFMDQESFETSRCRQDMIGDAQDFLGEYLIIQVHKYNGNPIGLQLPPHVELTIAQTEPGVRGDSSGENVTKPATLETGLESACLSLSKRVRRSRCPRRRGSLWPERKGKPHCKSR